MNRTQIHDGVRIYRPALILDSLLSRRLRYRVGNAFLVLVGLSGAALIAGAFFVPQIAPYERPLFGVFCIFLSLLLASLELGAFYDSYYFKDVRGTLKEPGRGKPVLMTFAVAAIAAASNPSDATAGFLRSSFGRKLLARLGIFAEDGAAFLASRKNRVPFEALEVPAGTVNILSYVKAIYDADQEFAQFLFKREIQEDDFMGAVDWVSNTEAKQKRRARKWSRDNLGRIPGLGKSFAFGRTYNLDQYGEELGGGVLPSETGVMREVEELEAALTSARGANALIVADAGSGETDIIYGLVGMIERGIVFPQLEGMRVFRIDTVALIDAHGGKVSFENAFIRLMNEAVRAGNVIVVIEDLPGFVENAASIGSDIVQLMAPYLRSTRAQIIATADRGGFHEVIERHSALLNAFEIVRVAEKDESTLITVLENFVPRVEWQTGAFFTYQAVKAVAESAVRFFSESVPLAKARDILSEVPSVSRADGRRTVTKDDVMTLVETKTGVPQEGKIKEGEQDKLLNLEALLHERVIGQDEAVDAVANAMRRARAGLRNAERPIGSFLFLGPTGVGKTETAKALGEVFFGTGTPMLRLDMSEYSGGDAVMRLIGSAGGRQGILATMLRDQKYGVLLLDEFEKTTSEVMNLFLQILDEGFFSDSEGKKVNARNLIVIATSNAGSEAIFKYTEEGKDLADAKENFTNMLIEQGLFKPELLNRFDGVILFHPLSRESLKQVAVLAVRKFARELKVQGVMLEPTDDLVNYLAEKGYEPKFGARPMNRVLQEKVEKLVADNLIAGKIARGATIALVRSAQNPDELAIRGS